MTENENSPENLRKFLESDDPAPLVRMGKLVEINEAIAVNFLLKNLEDKYTANPAIVVLNENVNWESKKIEKLKPMAVKLLTKKLSSDPTTDDLAIKNILIQIGENAIEPLIKDLESKNGDLRCHAADALRDIADKRAIKPLIKALEDSEDYYLRPGIHIKCAEALGLLGDERAVPSLINALDDEYRDMDGNYTVRKAASIALVKITRANIKGKKQDNIIKFLESKDPAMVRMGASMLKGILEE